MTALLVADAASQCSNTASIAAEATRLAIGIENGVHRMDGMNLDRVAGGNVKATPPLRLS